MMKLVRGGTGGAVWDHKGKTQISVIYISPSSSYITSLQFLYVENGNKLVLSERIGAAVPNATFFDTVILDPKTGYITWISGHHTSGFLASVTFGTNNGTYGLFQNPEYIHTGFNHQLGSRGHVFYGFCGTTLAQGIESIGVYLKPRGDIQQSSDRSATSSIQIKKE